MTRSRKALLLADKELFQIGKSVEILDHFAWPKDVGEHFLKHWQKGNKILPKIRYKSRSFENELEALRSIIRKTDKRDPLGIIIRETAQSYIDALKMVEATGKKRFTSLSQKLYGTPEDHIGKLEATTKRAASFILSASKQFEHILKASQADYCIRPEYVVSQLKKVAKKTFPDRVITIATNPKLVAKATAGPSRVQIRSSTCFAEHDIHQLIHHELLVHTLTLRNGRKQKIKTLGLNSPRTTRTQEGLAVFAEFITSAIDMNRLQRLGARVHAVDMGLRGANFIEVFEFFLSQGQTEMESFQSAKRIFRGGRVEGGVVFTKDIVYLRGFIEVHRFFLKALQDDLFMHPRYLFAGRVKTQDIEMLEPLFLEGYLKGPNYEPDWVKNRSTLLAYLLSSSMMNKLGLSRAM